MITSFSNAENIFAEVCIERKKLIATKEEQDWYDLKESHSRGVANIGCKILAKEQALDKIRSDEDLFVAAKSALLLHDIARFYQFVNKDIIKMDHGMVGSDLLQTRFRIDNPFVYLPVKYHNKLSLDDSLFVDKDSSKLNLL